MLIHEAHAPGQSELTAQMTWEEGADRLWMREGLACPHCRNAERQEGTSAEEVESLCWNNFTPRRSVARRCGNYQRDKEIAKT